LILEATTMMNTSDEQHQKSPDTVSPARLDEFLHHGFAVLALNQHDPNPDMPFEAWAYRGPLDFNIATPVVFGLGATGFDALGGLDELLAEYGETAPVPDVKGQVPLHVDDRELATILAALRFHQAENVQGTDEIPDQAIRQIATDDGRLEALNHEEIDQLCERLNLGAEGSYSQRWHCPHCHSIVTCSYEDLAEVGAPYCGNCDCEMEML